MSAETNQIRNRIRLLLNLAENDAATEGEIENAIRFARRLMDAHHLSEDECKNDPHAQAADEERGAMGKTEALSVGESLCSWERRLSAFVKQLVGGVDCYITSSQLRRTDAGAIRYDENGRMMIKGSVVFYGLDEEARLATEIHDDLAATIAAMARLKFGGALRGAGRSYGDGFVDGLHSKLRDAKQQDESTSSESRALVVRSAEVAKRKRENANNWLKNECGISLVSAGRSRAYSSNEGAYSSGHRDGRQTSVTVNRRKRIASSG
jgi:hypothetical protein